MVTRLACKQKAVISGTKEEEIENKLPNRNENENEDEKIKIDVSKNESQVQS